MGPYHNKRLLHPEHCVTRQPLVTFWVQRGGELLEPRCLDYKMQMARSHVMAAKYIQHFPDWTLGDDSVLACKSLPPPVADDSLHHQG